MRLPEMDPSVFKSHVHWAYTGLVVTAWDSQPQPKGQFNHRQFAELYAIADVLGDMRLRNAVIDRIVRDGKTAHVTPGLDTIQIAYTRTPEGSTLRKLALDWWRGGCHTNNFKEHFKEHSASFPKEFLADFVKVVMEGNGEKARAVVIKDRCEYHEHNDDVPTCSSCEDL